VETRHEEVGLLWRRCRGISRRLAVHHVFQWYFEGRLWRFLADVRTSLRSAQALQTLSPRAVNEQSRGVPGPSRLRRGLGDRREEGRRPQGRRRADQSRLSAVASPTAEGRKPGLVPQLRSRLGKPFGHGPHIAAATATLAPVPSASDVCLTSTTWAGSATSVVITA